MIYLPGGPSHMDMYDLKPDAPIEFRGEFKPIETNVPGVQICEHFPLQARMWDKLAVRPLASSPSTSIPTRLVMTGYSENINRTAASSVVRLGRVEAARRRQQRHPAVRQPARHVGRAPSRASSASRIGRSRPSGPGMENLRLAGGVNADRIDDRSDLLDSFDTVRRDIDASGTMKRHGHLHRPRLRHGRLRRRPQGPRPDQRRAAHAATATRASSSS